MSTAATLVQNLRNRLSKPAGYRLFDIQLKHRLLERRRMLDKRKQCLYSRKWRNSRSRRKNIHCLLCLRVCLPPVDIKLHSLGDPGKKAGR